jgi:3-hydroxymyristoyl/3-hydroxydecanoyl-(acyl carrier protein) dehydratase
MLDLIPHRPPWLLVDEVTARGEDRVEAVKRVTAEDPLVADGLPELLVLEALAQTAACANAGQLGAHRGLLVAAQKVSFAGRAQPGETITLRARRTASLGTLVRFEGEALVGERVIARAEMTFAVTAAP